MQQNYKKILFINRSAPYGTARAQEALDVLLMASAFGQTINLLFMNDGVLLLSKQQHPEAIAQKNFTKTFKALPLYDIHKVYVEKTSLFNYGLNHNDLIIETELIDNIAVGKLMHEHDAILSF